MCASVHIGSSAHVRAHRLHCAWTRTVARPVTYRQGPRGRTVMSLFRETWRRAASPLDGWTWTLSGVCELCARGFATSLAESHFSSVWPGTGRGQRIAAAVCDTPVGPLSPEMLRSKLHQNIFDVVGADDRRVQKGVSDVPHKPTLLLFAHRSATPERPDKGLRFRSY